MLTDHFIQEECLKHQKIPILNDMKCTTLCTQFYKCHFCELYLFLFYFDEIVNVLALTLVKKSLESGKRAGAQIASKKNTIRSSIEDLC